MTAASLPSVALLEAQQRLQQLRAQVRATRAATDPSLSTTRKAGLLSAGKGKSTAESSTGRSQALRNAQERLARYRRRDGVMVTSGDGRNRDDGPPLNLLPPQPEAIGSQAPLEEESVKHYPSLGVAALDRDVATLYRVWLGCRYLDKNGRGWLNQEAIREAFTDQESRLRLFSWRRLRQILHKGHRSFWTWDRKNGRVWLHGAARVAARLGVERLSGKPVALPMTAVVESIGTFKAHLYAAWHSGRKEASPVTRATQAEVTGVPARTQRRYCHLAGVERQRNIAVGPRYSQAQAQETAWQRGRAMFEFVDVEGRQGPRNGRYVAWHMPMTHVGPHRQVARGRQRKVNQKLKDLVNYGARGNSSQTGDRLYHRDGKAAGKAYNRHPDTDAYWHMMSVGQQTGRCCHVWGALVATEVM